jgi:hypothetical protein
MIIHGCLCLLFADYTMRNNNATKFLKKWFSGFSRRKQSAIGRFCLPSNELGPLVEVVDTADLKSAAE